jgi:hypothetical protein
MRLPDLDPLRAARGAAVPEADRASREPGTTPAETANSPQGDLVHVSGLAEHITGSLAPLTADHNLRVEGLTADYQAGRYTVEPLAVSRALIAHALLGTS